WYAKGIAAGEACGLPAKCDAMRSDGGIAQSVHDAEKPQVAADDRHAVDARRDADAQDAPDQAPVGPEVKKTQPEPGTAARERAEHGQTAKRVAYRSADGDAHETKLGKGTPAEKECPG